MVLKIKLITPGWNLQMWNLFFQVREELFDRSKLQLRINHFRSHPFDGRIQHVARWPTAMVPDSVNVHNLCFPLTFGAVNFGGPSSQILRHPFWDNRAAIVTREIRKCFASVR